MREEANPGVRLTVRDVSVHLRSFVKLDGGEFVVLLKEAGGAWADDKAPRLGAALAFYALLSIAPLLVVAIAIAALVFGKTAVEGQLFWQTRDLLGRDGATAVQNMIQNADRLGTGIFATSIGAVTLLFGASSVVIELGDALNTIWHVTPPSSARKWAGVTALVKERAYAFLLIIGTGIILLSSLVLNTALSAVETFFDWLLPVPVVVLRIVEFGFAYFITTILFAAIYKFMPAVKLKWSDVFIGACVTSLLFTIGKQLVGLYLGKESFASSYGAAGSLVTIMVWTYYSAQIFFLGAEFTKIYTRRFGSLKPGKRLPRAESFGGEAALPRLIAGTPIFVVRRVSGRVDAPRNHGWKLAYADFMTALMALFIVLWLLSDPAAPAGKRPAPVNEMVRMAENLRQAIQSDPQLQGLRASVEISVSTDGLRVDLLERNRLPLFESGRDDPTEMGAALLIGIARELGKLPNRVALEGHTDSKPFAGRKNYTNWELSIDRANAARRVMSRNGLRPGQVSQVFGSADRNPGTLPGQSPEDSANRRVTVIVQYARG